MTIDETLERIMNETDIGTIHALAMSAYEQAKKPAVCWCLACRGEKQHTTSPATSDVEMVREMVEALEQCNFPIQVVLYSEESKHTKSDVGEIDALVQETLTKATAWLADRGVK